MIAIFNAGPDILHTDFWGSDYDRTGKLFVSTNANYLRVLVPRLQMRIVGECLTAQYVILSRGPLPDAGTADAVELLFEDGTDSPFVFHLTPESFDTLPAEPPPGRSWQVALWICRGGKPHKALELECRWRRVPSLPWLKPWEERPTGERKP